MGENRYSSEDYAYSSALLRTLEDKLIGKGGIAKLSSCDNINDAWKALSSFGINTEYEGSKADLEKTLDSYLRENFKKVSESVPEPSYFDFVKYPYDCHNLKSALKCRFRKRDFGELYIPLGFFSKEEIEKGLDDKKYGFLPENLSKAMIEAEEGFKKSADPQIIDTVIDRACYADMLKAAKRANCAFFVDYLRKKIDVTNIMTFIRLERMNSRSDSFGEFFIEGGFIDKEQFGKSDYKKLFDKMGYGRIAKVSDERLSVIEREADLCIRDFYKKSKETLCGADVALGFLLEIESEVKNVRIIFASLSAGLGPDDIKERLRIS